MRKQARFMIVALVMLLVPALANAWTLTVKVTGGNATDFVRVEKLELVGTTLTPTTPVLKEVKNGTVYLYPSGPVRISLQGSTVPPMATVDGKTPTSGFPVDLSSGSHTVAVAYDPVAAAGTLTLKQATEGGQIYAQNRNSTWSATKVSGIELNSVVPVTIAADYNHRIAGYYAYTGPATGAARGTLITTDIPDTLGGVKTLYLPADGKTIEPEFALVAKISASLFAPTDGAVDRPINCIVVAASNVANLQYAVVVKDPDGVALSGIANAKNFSFIPDADGVYTIEVTVSSTVVADNTLAPTVLTAKVNVALALKNANADCTSCHGTSFPDKDPANQLAAGIHSANATATCASCHPGDKAHSTSGLMGGALQGRLLLSHATVSTLATLSGAIGAVGITTDGTNLYIPGANTIYQVAIATGVTETVTTTATDTGITTNGTARFTATNGITTDDVYLYRIGASGVEKTSIQGTPNWVPVAPIPGTMRGITTDGVNLYVTAGNQIYMVPIATPAAADPITPSAALSAPEGITSDGTNLYVVDGTTIQKVDPAGEVSLVVSIPATTYGITTDGFNLYVTDSTGSQVLKVELSE